MSRQALFSSDGTKLKTFAMMFGALALCVGCKDGQLRPKNYPAGVPKYAVWAGGPQGGAYISCTVDKPRNVNFCRVWNDYTGKLVESGDYQLLAQYRLAMQDELSYRGADFNGDIWLQNGWNLTKLN
jgi:hypothetical protein